MRPTSVTGSCASSPNGYSAQAWTESTGPGTGGRVRKRVLAGLPSKTSTDTQAKETSRGPVVLPLGMLWMVVFAGRI